MGFASKLLEGFTDRPSEEEQSWLKRNSFFLLLIFIKLLFIYIVMLLWPKVMPKLFPKIVKQPTYVNLLGLSIILSLI